MNDNQEIEQEIEYEDILSDEEYDTVMETMICYDDISIGTVDVSRCCPSTNNIELVFNLPLELDKYVQSTSNVTHESVFITVEQSIIATITHEVLHLVLNNVESYRACHMFDNINIADGFVHIINPPEIDREFVLIQLTNGSWISKEI